MPLPSVGDQVTESPMDAPRAKARNWLGICLGLVLLAVVGAAAIYWGMQPVIAWYASVTTLSLDSVVARFNESASNDPVGRLEPPLTSDEVVAAIRQQLPTLRASPQVIKILRRIEQSRTLPTDATFHADSGYTTRAKGTQIVWWINLDLVTGKNAGYGLRVRENNSPRAASLGSDATN
jgi:hypothetical protein